MPSSRRTTPLPKDWRSRIVPAVKRRDLSCRWIENSQICGSVERLEVDHIGDPSDHRLENLRLLCHMHHDIRTRQQISAAMKHYHANRPHRRRPAEQHPGLL